MNILKLGVLIEKNQVDYTDFVVYNGDWPIELSIVCMTTEDMNLIFKNNKRTVSLRTFYTVKNPEVVFLLVKNTWHAIDKSGRQMNLTEMLQDPVVKAKMVLGL